MLPQIRDEMIYVWFQIKVIARDLDIELRDYLCSSMRTFLTNKGILIIPLKKNRNASFQVFPKNWRRVKNSQAQFPYEPCFFDGALRILYDFPRELAEVNHQLVFESYEARSPGSYCQVSTSGSGGQLRPLRWRKEAGDSSHPSVVAFSTSTLHIVRLEQRPVYHQDALFIRQANVELVAGFAAVTVKQWFYLADPPLKASELPLLPSRLENWQPALRALYERWECQAESCDGHYHL